MKQLLLSIVAMLGVVTMNAQSKVEWTAQSSDTYRVGCVCISWSEVAEYDGLMMVMTIADDKDYSGWGAGGIYASDCGTCLYSFGIVPSATNTNTFTISFDELKKLAGEDDVEVGYFFYNIWSPITAVEVYFGVGDIETKYNKLVAIKSDSEAVEVARYNLAGQKLSGEQPGINIIVYSDGSSKKVLVK